MLYFARVVFWLDDDNSFNNLSNTPIQLFAYGDIACTAHIDKRFNRHKVILEYGAFSTKEEAEENGISLVRLIKLEMIKREFIIDISSRPGVLDTSAINVEYGGHFKWTEFCDDYERKYGQAIPRDLIVENECIGLGVYEVKQNLSEIQFTSGAASVKLEQGLSLQHETFAYWDDAMDTSLSLLSSSIGVNDTRIKFLMRLMAIETLAAPPQLRDSEYLAVIDRMTDMAENLDIKPEHKEMLKSQLGMFKEKSISQKVNELFETYLAEKTYIGLSPKKFFAQCYKVRSGFVHSGASSGVNFEMIRTLKSMVLDLLYAMSKQST